MKGCGQGLSEFARMNAHTQIFLVAYFFSGKKRSGGGGQGPQGERLFAGSQLAAGMDPVSPTG